MAKKVINERLMKQSFKKKTLSELCAENVVKARSGKFRGFDFIVKANEDLLDKPFVLEVDDDGIPTRDSHLLLQEQAKTIMLANFKQKNSRAQNGLGWAKATWSTSEAARKAGLDPTKYNEFEVGLAIARNPSPDRAARVLELVSCTANVDGVTLVPGADGRHLDIPGAGILFTQGLVLVKRNQHDLELTSFVDALFKRRVREWAKPGVAEQAEMRARKKARAKAEAEKAEAEDCFAAVMAALEQQEAREEQQRQREAQAAEAERLRVLAEEWGNIVSSNPELVQTWDEIRSVANVAWEEARGSVGMVLGLTRPGKPSKEALGTLVKEFSRNTCEYIAAWLRDTHAQRRDRSLSECVNMLRQSEASGLVVEEWFLENGDARPSLQELSRYSSRAEWLSEIETFPSLSDNDRAALKELEDKKATT